MRAKVRFRFHGAKICKNLLKNVSNQRCVWACFYVCELMTKTERQSEERIRRSEIVVGRERECVCFPTHQGHPKLECDWKSPVCLGCLPHKIIQTGCSADNVTVLTTSSFSFCFKLSMKWQECANVIPTRTHARSNKLRQRHTQPTLSDV